MSFRSVQLARLALVFLSLAGATPVLAQWSPWRWATNTGSTVMGQTTAQHSATTPTGEVYVLGTFKGQVSFGTSAFQPVIGPYPASGGDVFLAKYDSAGQLLWARAIGGDNEDNPRAVATDAQGNAYVGVEFSSRELTLAGSTLLNAGGDSLQGYGQFYDVALAKIDGAGQWQWARHLGGSNDDFLGGLAVDATGNLYAAGSMEETDSVGGFQVSGETWVTKLDGTGQWLWVSNGGATPGGGGAYALALDPAGSTVFVGGAFMNTGVFGATTLTAVVSGSSSFDYDGYVGGLSAATGQWQWVKAITSIDVEYVTALATDSAGGVVAGGAFAGDDVQLGTVTLLSAVDRNVSPYSLNSFVTALSGTGQWRWSTLAAGLSDNNVTAVATGPGDEVYVSGIGDDSIHFGTSGLSWPNSDNNSYLARLNGTTGTWEWSMPMNQLPACGCGHLATQYAGVSVDAEGTLRLTSTYTDSARFDHIPLVGPLFFSNGSGQQQGYVASFRDILPVLRTISPVNGAIGSGVTLTGLNFGAATRVMFNGVPAVFTVVSPTQISVTVPVGATNGLVSVTTPTGTVNSPVAFRVSGTTGLAAEGATAFGLYPNPATRAVQLTLAPASQAATAEVRDALGRTVIRQLLTQGQTTALLPLTGLSAGVYSVRVGAAIRRLAVE